MSSNDAGEPVSREVDGTGVFQTVPNATANKPGEASPSGVGGAAPTAKVCVRCGMDLNGKQRLKDVKGYWCAECAEAERQERLRSRLVKCEECGRTVPRNTVAKVGGRKLCDLCSEGRAPDAADASDSFLFAQKLCSVCTRDVTNEKRLWNGTAYVCVACHEAELEKSRAQREARARERSHRVRCLECGDKVPADTLIKVDGLEICQACAEAQQVARRKHSQQKSESQLEFPSRLP